MLTLSDAADYMRTMHATQLLLQALRATRRLLTFTEERENRASRYVAVVRSYQNGAKLDEIVRRYGCSKRTVFNYLDRAGVPRRTKVSAVETRNSVIRDYKNGIKCARIAELNDVSLRYVMKVAEDAGLSRKKRNE